ncbi:MAG: low molecular weight phosphatase family protein [Phycisphaerae bacterium]|nr:low molecular weight phosphatase family protein [Phycisphaerae bacterium]
MKTVLFLCTGNYYRSRFAEVLFNHLAQLAKLSWRADSSGLALEFGTFNIGPISRDTLAQLKTCGISHNPSRNPKQCTVDELKQANLVVALKEAEHRPMLKRRYPGWAERVEYWHVHDLDQATADAALSEIDLHVRALIERLKQDEHG